MKITFVADDMEAAGLTPGKYSMLSLGACIVGRKHERFYREIKPINYNYLRENTRIGSIGLDCLKHYRGDRRYNPHDKEHFSPELVLLALEDHGVTPEEAMSDFADWIIDKTGGTTPIELAWPIKFDGGWTSWYFDNFYDKPNPLGYSGFDIKSFFLGVVWDAYNTQEFRITTPPMVGVKHNALDDSIRQATEFEEVLRIAKKRRKLLGTSDLDYLRKNFN